ncbi:hypothetical protein LFM09_03790 [Lentzea alba]|uniref:hypothetical protein n=1 Tax=Lentzea alba TaxID=2714351 RepID=UPI0039BFC6BE
MSAPTLRAIATLEHTPGAIAEALNGWTRFVHGPARAIDDYGEHPHPDLCCHRHDPADCRAALHLALMSLPAKAARELRALVRPLDELFLARSIPSPGHAYLRGLVE